MWLQPCSRPILAPMYTKVRSLSVASCTTGWNTHQPVTAATRTRNQASATSPRLRARPLSHGRGSSTDLRRPCGPSALLPPALLTSGMSDTFRSGARRRLAAGPPGHRISRRGPRPRLSHRWASGTGFRGSGPMYSDCGRIRRLWVLCSRTCADHPATRETANVGGKYSVGSPIA